ncbi:cycle-inhibiting factor [Escherichia coli]|nr:cycle-inhibiting factor [Escherichia coli]EGF7413229.1 cycle-inhibiting factor [Escherichia coli]EGF7454356.1 cycle-inhibiting factor [Escherichia coli]
MRVVPDAFSPSSSVCPQNSVSVGVEATSHPSGSASALHVREFSSLCSQNFMANVLLNSDDHSVPIHKKKPSVIMEAIDNNLAQMANDWGVSFEEVEAIIGRKKGIVEPSCGVTANTIMKLFLDQDDFSYSFEKQQPLSLSELLECLSSLPEQQNFILRVNDGGLGHAYVIDIPAGANIGRSAFLYQSDLGEGVTRKLRFEDWMVQKALNPIPLDDIYRYFTCMAQNKVDLVQIAKLFDIDGNAQMLRPEHILHTKCSDFNFQLFEYDARILEKNISIIKILCN